MEMILSLAEQFLVDSCNYIDNHWYDYKFFR